MGEQFFDDLARGLDDGTISRGRALKLFGAAALGTALMPVLPKHAEALSRNARRRCHRKGGVPLEKGNCHCAITCAFASDKFTCQGNPSCTCFKTVTGSGFCAATTPSLQTRCSPTEGCSVGPVCVVNPGCPGSGGSCTPATVATDCPSNMGCVNGRCQLTSCVSPCPPPP